MIILTRDDSSKLEGRFKGSQIHGLARRLVNSSNTKDLVQQSDLSKNFRFIFFSSVHFVQSKQKFWPEGSAQEHIDKYHGV